MASGRVLYALRSWILVYCIFGIFDTNTVAKYEVGCLRLQFKPKLVSSGCRSACLRTPVVKYSKHGSTVVSLPFDNNVALPAYFALCCDVNLHPGPRSARCANIDLRSFAGKEPLSIRSSSSLASGLPTADISLQLKHCTEICGVCRQWLSLYMNLRDHRCMEFGCGMYGVNCYNIPVRISRRNKVLPKFISGKKANLNNCIQISTLNESPVLHTNETIVTHNNVKPIPVRISSRLIIAGDFNIHMDDLAHVDTCRFSELLETFGLVQHVNFATHRSGHWLDLIITRSSNDVMVASPRPSLFLSDHCFAECVLAISSPGAIVKDVCFRKFSGIDFSAFRADITSSNLSELPDKDLAANYDSTLRAILEKHAPVQYKVKVVRPRVPWFNKDLMRLKARRRKLEKKMRKTNNVSDISTYRNVCNEYCLLLKNTKTTYYSDMIEHCAGDSKRLFQVVRSLCKERSDNLLPHSDHPRQLANEFGEYFCRKISLIREKIASCDSTPPDLSIPSPSIRLDKFIQVSEVEVRNIIMSSSNASCHLDPFPTWLVKKCVDQLAPLITKMINSSLESGTVPENWKVALIVPILKKFGLDLVFMNFRPISNLPFVSKTAEKVVASQILDHCSAHAPLAACQSSYRKHHSTETALLKVQSDILLSMDRQEVTLLVLLDLIAAFDTIDHDIMINLLENDFGITDQALSWLKSFLSGRKQRVVIGQQQSEDFDVISGVPQGSCLGPLLFIMYTSQLFHLVKKHLPTAHGYADDTKLYLSFRPISTVSQDHAIQAMEDCISDIHNWTTHHRLMMNDDKTEFLIIGSRQQLAKINISNVHVGSSEILPVNSVRDLGAWLDETMSMDVHIGKICSKAFRGLYKIRQIRKFLSEESTETLIHAFVTVHLDYCNSLLSGVPQRQMDRLQKVFNAAARVVYYIPRYAHITPVLMRLHWLPISYRIKFKIALLVFKALKDMAPTYIRELLELKPLSRYALRSDTQNLLKVPRTKCKTFGDRAFAVAGPRVWSQLPLDIRTSATVDTFKNRLKTYFYKLAFL